MYIYVRILYNIYISSIYPTPSHPPITYSIPCHNGPKSSSHASISIDVLQLRSIVTEGWTHRALGGFRLVRWFEAAKRRRWKTGMGTQPGGFFWGGRWMGRHSFLKKKKSARFFIKAPKKPPQLKHEIPRCHHNVGSRHGAPVGKFLAPQNTSPAFFQRSLSNKKTSSPGNQQIALLCSISPWNPCKTKKRVNPPKFLTGWLNTIIQESSGAPAFSGRFPGFFTTVIEK